jgi:O-antigen/teichoic acid export membrane protein
MKLFKNLLSRFRSSEFTKNTAVLSLGTAFSQGIFIASMPILSRLYTPEDFGLLAVFVAISTIVATVITLRYETAILIPKNEDESISLVLLSAALAVILGIVLALLMLALPELIKNSMGISLLNDWQVLAVLLGVMTALIAIATSWYNRKKAYLNIVKVRIGVSTITAVIGIGAGLYDFHVGMMAAQFIATLLVLGFVLIGLRSLLKNWRDVDFPSAAKKHDAAPKYLLPAALLDVVTLQLPILLIAAWFSGEESGQFSMAWKVLALPMALFGAAIGQVFFQKFSEVWPDAKAAQKLLFKTWKTLFVIGFLPALIIMMFGEWLFKFFLGDAWGDAGRMAMILAPMLFIILISSPTSSSYLVLGMQRYSLFFGIAVFFYRPLCLFFGLMQENLFIGLMVLAFVEIIQVVFYQYLVVRKIKGTL